ncbi:hypothetical protein VX037_18155 [Gordonia sp. Z-3]|uniref:hypothetical protein n=1 Tax=Gordonia sp. Z-3 TaxID=3115408 RepID=UPI002E2A6F4B|nr:hypothetical protein [Gordonia sp. Z-3]MED5802951.1 hypothetical protein [Gordonia sp. Z-3]
MKTYLADTVVNVVNKGTPTWITVVTAVIAAAALILSAYQALSKWHDGRRTGPTTRVSAAFTDKLVTSGYRLGNLPLVVSITIENVGREPTRIRSLFVRGENAALNGMSNVLDLPHPPDDYWIIEGHSTKNLLVDAQLLTGDDRVELVCHLGHGKTYRRVLERNEFRRRRFHRFRTRSNTSHLLR